MKKIRVSHVVGYIILGLVVVLSLYPVLWLLISSLKSTSEFIMSPVYTLPEKITFSNYVDAWTLGNMGTYFINSVICTFAALALTVILVIPLSFALSKMKWRAKKFFNSYFVFGLMVPIQVALIPIFTMFKGMNLLNSLFGLVLAYTAFGMPLSVLLFTGFFEGLPDEMIEAAAIDGCSIYQILIRILLPLMRNTIVTVLTLTFLNTWNDLLFSQTLISDTAYKTVQNGLYMFQGARGAVDWGPMFAAMAIACIPTLFLYFFLSKFMMQGMTAGAVKG